MNKDELYQKIVPILKKNGVRRAAVFGSFSRGEETKESDLDLMIVLGRPMGMIAFVRMKREIEHVAGRRVDIVVEKSINRHVRPYIEKDLVPIYEE
ncbi:MAG: nucleotidyltransferase family protein [bacterium]|nr:nucleotidyltransferase family protein [bacterium]